jgi:hypothetical protein
MATGFHGFHVLIGTIFLFAFIYVVCLIRLPERAIHAQAALRLRRRPPGTGTSSTWSWLFLFAFIYVILIAGAVCAFGALFSMFAWNWPVWLLLIVWLPAVLVLTLGLMRPAKGLMVAAQIAHKASEAGRGDV